MTTTASTRFARSRWLGRRYLLAVGGLRIASYTTMLYLGCVSGILVGAEVAGATGLSVARFSIASVLLLIPALLGARLWFVFQHIEHFRRAPRRIWRHSDGGSALYGGLVLSVVVSIAVLPLFGLSFWRFWDAAGVTMLVGLIPTRAGCLMHGCCAGRPTDGRFGLWLPNDRGEWRRRVPTQILEAGWAALVVAVGLAARSSLPFAGALFAVLVAGYAAGRLLLELGRETKAAERTIGMNVTFSAVLFVVAAGLLTVGWLS